MALPEMVFAMISGEPELHDIAPPEAQAFPARVLPEMEPL